jgi:hypothetical protein
MSVPEFYFGGGVQSNGRSERDDFWCLCTTQSHEPPFPANPNLHFIYTAVVDYVDLWLICF